MDNDIIVAIIAFVGTFVGTIGGILASSKLTNYRLEQLEKKIEGQGKTIEEVPLLHEKVKRLEARVNTLEKYHIEKI